MQAQAVALHPLGHRQERQVEHVVAEHLGHLLARLLADRELDPRMALMEDGQRERHVDRAHRVHGADHHVPGAHPGERLHLGGRGVDLGQDPPRAGDQRPPASVTVTRRVVRSTRARPTSCSSRRICCESAGWAMCSRAAARVKCCSSARATR